VEGCRRGRVPERGRQGAGRLCFLLRARLISHWGTSSAASCTTTGWSWYTLFPTPSLQFRPSSIFVRRIWGYRHTFCCGGIFFCVKSTSKRSGPVGDCDVQLEVWPQSRVDR
jgi:hypothetical protein